MFNKFIRACYKHQFSYALSNVAGETKLILRPNNSFENINLELTSSYHRLFKDAIKIMKDYRLVRRRKNGFN